jgi:hypothetical protein
MACDPGMMHAWQAMPLVLSVIVELKVKSMKG